MIAKFNTSNVNGVNSGNNGGMVKTVFIIGIIAAIGYGIYRYMNNKKNVTTVFVDDEN